MPMLPTWLIGTLAVAVTAGAAVGVLAVTARPAPDHPYFATENPRVQVIAHRGGAGLRPENTLAAFAHAVAVGADVLEMDVQPAADGAIVVIHDATVDRTTGGRGRVDSFTLGELRKLDAGHNWSNDGGRTHPYRGKGIRIPTLEEVFSGFPATRMILEMKHGGAALARPLCELIRRARMEAKALVASMNVDAVASFRSACPEVLTAMNATEARIFHGAHLAGLEFIYSPPVMALLVPDRLRGEIITTAALVQAARRRNLRVHVWTINEQQRMRELLQIGVAGIITDRPDRLVELLGRPGASR
jgi:glycerophosphoryl diester phosphodiesterase